MAPEPRPNRGSSPRTIHRPSRARLRQAVLASDEPLDLPSEELLEPVLLVSLFEAPPESPPELVRGAVRGRGLRGRVAAGLRRAAVVAVEARALEHDAHRVEHLAEPALALGADRQGVLGEALHDLEEVSALGAGVLIGGHGWGPPGSHTGEALALDAFDCQCYGTMPVVSSPQPPLDASDDAQDDERGDGRDGRSEHPSGTGPAGPAGRRTAWCCSSWSSWPAWWPGWWWRGGRCRRPTAPSSCPGSRTPSTSSATPTASPSCTPTTAPTCSTPRASCRRRTGSSRWTSGGTSPPGGSASSSARAPSRRTCTSARWGGAESPSRSSTCSARRRRATSRPTATG